MAKLAMSPISATKTMAATSTTKLAPIDNDAFAVKWQPVNSWQYEDHYGNDQDNWIYANDGPDYVAAGGGNDYINAGNNSSAWGGSGNEFTAGATVIDAGAGNDTVQVWADRGAFNIMTGDGDDHVLISNDADFVRIDNYNDAAGASEKGDVFEFGMGFSGKAVIWSFDQNDRIHFNGLNTDASKFHDWDLISDQGGVAKFYNAVTTGEIEVQHASNYDVDVTGVDNFAPTAQFPYGGFMYYMDWNG